ncbi:MAG: DUF177 domain-containing protein [Oscillospiraceae bacterium]|jgi:uncharacterized protein|nr:DUF177 domain-containing protein [Oscillospiraceae bacterium]
MVLDVSAIFNTPGMTLPFAFDLPQGEPYDTLPFARPAHVVGQARNRVGIVELTGTVQVCLHALCARCAVSFNYETAVPLEHTLVNTRESEDSDELIFITSDRFLLDELVWEDIVLFLPSRFLCKPDCQGLCPRCGQNRNESVCNCKPKADPRLAALRSLLPE